MGKSTISLVGLVVLGALVVALAVAKSLIQWEWWDFLLVLSGMAFVVGLVLFVLKRILRLASS